MLDTLPKKEGRLKAQCARRNVPGQTQAPSTIERKIFAMSRKCEVTGVRPLKGRVIHRRGLAKKRGGVGMHVTATNVRVFDINLKKRRVWVPELNKFVTVKLTAKALKTINKNGAYKTLKEAGLLKSETSTTKQPANS
jgi:large subunit ribosomal protein L28